MAVAKTAVLIGAVCVVFSAGVHINEDSEVHEGHGKVHVSSADSPLGTIMGAFNGMLSKMGLHTEPAPAAESTAPVAATSSAVGSSSAGAAVKKAARWRLDVVSAVSSHVVINQPSAVSSVPVSPAPVADDELSKLKAMWKAESGRDTFLTKESNAAEGLPAFKYMFPEGEADQGQVATIGALEPTVSFNLARDMKECCAAGGNFIDVGGNFGWFALLGASMGCKVDTFEPVPWFYQLINYTSHYVNEPPLNDKMTLHAGKILWSTSGETHVMSVPKSGLMGAASVDGINVNQEDVSTFNVTTTTLDEQVDASKMKICGMKVDVEGTEPEVFKGATKMLAAKPANIVIELSPGMSDKDHLGMLQQVVALGYKPHFFPWSVAKSGYWADIHQPMDNYSPAYGGDLPTLIQECGFNCMVYFK